MKDFESNLQNVGQMFGNYQVLYKIPILQRKYVWQHDDVKDLLDDLELSFTNDPQSLYFIGGMVFSRDGGERLIVIDGQQRLTTLMLLISAAVEYFKNANMLDQENYYKKILGTIYQNPETGDLKEQFFLELQDKDDPVFRKLLQGITIDKQELSVSENNLIMAKETCVNFIKEVIDVKKFMANLLSKVYVVKTVAADQSTAFKIFETLNDRGTPLEPEDLLKNLLLQSLGDDEYETFAATWQKFIDNLMNKGKYVVRIPTFLKHYIMSKGTYISKNDIFDWFKKMNFTNDDINDLLEELEYSSRKYREFIEGKINKSIGNMKKLSFKQGNIILLACLKLPSKDFNLICSALENVAFSYIITDSKTNQLEKVFCEIAKKAREACINNDKVKDVIQDLNNIALEKRILVKSFLMEFRFETQSDKRKVEYILEKLANSLDGGSYQNFTIEHILPEKRNGELSSLNDIQYKELVSRLGNLTLVGASDNSSLLNKTFLEKQQVYQNIPCRITCSLAKELETGTLQTKFDKAIAAFNYSPIPKKWDEEEINKRIMCIVELADHVWFNSL